MTTLRAVLKGQLQQSLEEAQRGRGDEQYKRDISNRLNLIYVKHLIQVKMGDRNNGAENGRKFQS